MDIIGIGRAVKDFLITINEMPPQDSHTALNDYSSQGGGKVSSAMIAAARLGMETAMYGVIGDDSKGRFISEDFKRHGTDTSHLIVDKGTKNTFCICVAEKVSQTRRFFGESGTARDLTVEDLDYNFLKKARAIHLDSGNAVARKAAQFAKSSNILVSMDADQYREELEEMEALTDIFIASEFYYEGRCRSMSHRELCCEMAGKGCRVAMITLGSKGCVGVADGEYFELPAFKNVNVIDTTGAGDIFHGAYLSAYLKGLGAVESATFASAVSAIKCTRIGGRAGIPDWDTTLHFLKNGEILSEELDRRVKFYRELVV